MQSFRDESNLKQYYHSHYTFAGDCEGQQANVRTDGVNNSLNTLSTSTVLDCDVKKGWMETVNWSPARRRSRNHRKKQERKKQEELTPWIVSLN